MLEGREKYIFERGLLTDEPLTLQEIGEEYSVSRERARQIEKRLTERLRAYLVQEMGEYLPFEVEGEAAADS
jgi:RNA polymerase sigma-32 factor